MACGHYVSAADNYAKARNDPQSRHIESSLLIIGRSHARLKCKGAIAGPQLGATGRDPTGKEITELIGITLRMDVAADMDHNAQNSAQICMDALAIAGRFNPTNYVTALLEECLAKLEQARKHKAEACGHYAKVTENYTRDDADAAWLQECRLRAGAGVEGAPETRVQMIPGTGRK